MSGRKSNTICAVVQRPDHHCGDDLVLISHFQGQTQINIDVTLAFAAGPFINVGCYDGCR